MAQFSTRRGKHFNPTNIDLYEVHLSGGSVPAYIPAGNLNTGSDAFGRMRTSEPRTVFDSAFRYSDSERKWNAKTTGTTSATFDANNCLMDLTVGSSNGDQIIRETDRVFAYQPGKSLLIMATFTMETAKENLRQRVGYFGKNNGIYLEQDGSDVYIVKRSFGTGSVVNTRVAQSSWNIDKMDKSGDSGIQLDLTKSQIFWIDVEWFGVGSVRCGFVVNGQFICTHIFHHANQITGTYMTTATLPLRYEITNTGATSGNSTLKQICSTVISEGGYEQIGLTRSASNPITGKNLTSNIDNPMVSIRLRPNHTDAVVVPAELTFYGLQDTAFKYKIIRGGTLTGASWQFTDSNSSTQYDLSATAISGGRTIFEGLFKGQASVIPLNLQEMFNGSLQLTRQIIEADSAGEALSLVIRPTTNNDDAIVALSWQENVT